MGGSTPTTQTVYQQQQIPAYQQQYATENQDLARQIAAMPYQPYQGQRIADWTPMQQMGFDQLGDAALQAQLKSTYEDTRDMLFNRAQDVYGGTGPISPEDIARQYSGVNTQLNNRVNDHYNGKPLSVDTIMGGYGDINSMLNNRINDTYNGKPLSPADIAGQYAGINQYLVNRVNNSYSDTINPEDISPWMSSYVEQALNPQLEAIQRQSDANRQRIDASGTAAGAFGDARQGVEQGENDRNTAQLMADTRAAGYQAAYDRAVSAAQGAFNANAGQFNADRAAQIQSLEDWARNVGTSQGTQLQSFGAGAGQFNAERASQLQALQQRAGNLGAAQGTALQSFGAGAGQYNTEIARQLQALGQQSQNINASQGTQLQSYNTSAGQYNTEMARQLQAIGLLPSTATAEYGYQSQAAQDLFNLGKEQQQQNQAGITTAYQDYLNQMEYPQEMLNLRLATQAGTPYNTTRLTTTPYSGDAQNLGVLASLIGLLGKPAGG